MTEYGLSISYFEPYKNGAEECGENGLPVCPSTTKIIGNGQLLVLKSHDNLQELAHIEKGEFGLFYQLVKFLNSKLIVDSKKYFFILSR